MTDWLTIVLWTIKFAIIIGLLYELYNLTKSSDKHA
jgi:hypothetical protein